MARGRAPSREARRRRGLGAVAGAAVLRAGEHQENSRRRRSTEVVGWEERERSAGGGEGGEGEGRGPGSSRPGQQPQHITADAAPQAQQPPWRAPAARAHRGDAMNIGAHGCDPGPTQTSGAPPQPPGRRSPKTARRKQLLSPECPDAVVVTDAAYGDPRVGSLSQLSDLVTLETSQQANTLVEYRAEYAQPECHPATADEGDVGKLPSQPDLPSPDLVPLMQDAVPGGLVGPEGNSSLPLAPAAEGSAPVYLQGPHLGALQGELAPASGPEEQDAARSKERGRQTRRGPMDEMRQLVRILVKIVPHSMGLIASAEEGGGGNRISEDQIKLYLDGTLGEAPRPAWGVPGGWGTYLAALFSWVLEKEVTKEEAMRCAKREPGRSWEAMEYEMHELGIYPVCWPLPLTREGIRQARQTPVPQPMPQSNKRSGDALTGLATKKLRGAVGDPESLSELEAWQALARLLQVARKKLGTTAADMAAVTLAGVRAEVQTHFTELLAASMTVGPQPQIQIAMPVLVQGANGQLQTAYHVQPAGMPLNYSTAAGLTVGLQPTTTTFSGVHGGTVGPHQAAVVAAAAPVPASGTPGAEPLAAQLVLAQPSSAFQAIQPALPLPLPPAAQAPPGAPELEAAPPVAPHEVTKPQAIRASLRPNKGRRGRPTKAPEGASTPSTAEEAAAIEEAEDITGPSAHLPAGAPDAGAPEPPNLYRPVAKKVDARADGRGEAAGGAAEAGLSSGFRPTGAGGKLPPGAPAALPASAPPAAAAVAVGASAPYPLVLDPSQLNQLRAVPPSSYLALASGTPGIAPGTATAYALPGAAAGALPGGVTSLQALHPPASDAQPWQPAASTASTWVPSLSAALR